MRPSLLFLAVIVFPFTLGAQMNRLLRDGAEACVRNKDWYGAEQYYGRLYSRDTSNTKIAYQYAEAARLNNNVVLAQSIYGRIAAKDEGRKYPLAYFWLAEVLRTRENYSLAKKWFARFLDLNPDERKFAEYIARANRDMAACDFAAALKKHPVSKPPESLGASFNTRSSEFAAVQTDSAIYFSALRMPDRRDPAGHEPAVFSKIYSSERKRGKWTRPRPFDTIVNANLTHNANITMSADGRYMVFARCVALNAADYSCGLYLSEMQDGKWTRPEKIRGSINGDFNTTQPMLADFGGKLTLFFSSNRPGGVGGMDIWYATMKEDRSFSEPVNAGPKVNTSDDEITPWYRESDTSLYFASTWHKGMGGHDIFRSPFRNGAFAEPVNGGYPLNSGYNDMYFSTDRGNKHVYLSSNRVGSASESKYNCCSDLYVLNIDTVRPAVPPLPVDTVKAKKTEMRELVPLTLYFHNDEPDPKTKSTTTTRNYESVYRDYMRMKSIYADRYSADLQGEAREQAATDIDIFFTDSVEAGFNDLVKFTDLLEDVLKRGETVKITMKGYCSPLASTDYNINLAKRRISSLRNYFLQAKGGTFRRYVDAAEGGRIIFEEVEIGELAASHASDNLRDQRSSVYSPAAAQERKIQIIAVGFGEP